MVNKLTRAAVIVILGFTVLLTIAPSLVACLLGIALACGLFDYFKRRNHNHARSFNAALRSVCYQQGAITRIASAFSRAGPLRKPCHDFTRRLLNGEPPIDAAVASGVPLQLRTAIAFENTNLSSDWQRDQDAADSELARVDSVSMPIYGQFTYLAGTAAITLLTIAFIYLNIVPLMKNIMEEFGLDVPFQDLFNLVPLISKTILLLGLLAAASLLAVRFFDTKLPAWVPMMPRRAKRKAEFLLGLADGYDAGIPVDRTLEIALALNENHAERNSLDRAIRQIQAGTDPLEALRRNGWLKPQEAASIDQTDPARTAHRLRSTADQNLRDSAANLRWLMAIFYPITIGLMGLAVAAIAISFFGSLMGLTVALS